MFKNFRKTKSYLIGGKICCFAVPILFAILRWAQTRDGFGAFFAFIAVFMPALTLFVSGFIALIVCGINQASKNMFEENTNLISDIGFVAASILISLFILYMTIMPIILTLKSVK